MTLDVEARSMEGFLPGKGDGIVTILMDGSPGRGPAIARMVREPRSAR
jgi:hypothetical protein